MRRDGGSGAVRSDNVEWCEGGGVSGSSEGEWYEGFFIIIKS